MMKIFVDADDENFESSFIELIKKAKNEDEKSSGRDNQRRK